MNSYTYQFWKCQEIKGWNPAKSPKNQHKDIVPHAIVKLIKKHINHIDNVINVTIIIQINLNDAKYQRQSQLKGPKIIGSKWIAILHHGDYGYLLFNNYGYSNIIHRLILNQPYQQIVNSYYIFSKILNITKTDESDCQIINDLNAHSLLC